MFQIEINYNTTLHLQKDLNDLTVPEAIETIYYSSADCVASLVWNGCKLLLFGVTIGNIYNNIISTVTAITSNSETFLENFLDSAFTARWEFAVNGDNIHITAYWFDIVCIEGDIMSVPNSVIMPKNKIIHEFDKLLSKIKEDLTIVGYDNSLYGFEYLETITSNDRLKV